MNNAAAKNSRSLDNYPDRLRPDQAAQYLNCSVDNVLRLIRTGALAAVDLSAKGAAKKTYRVEKPALIAFENSRLS
jgi:excisionase family DNA binding protein